MAPSPFSSYNDSLEEYRILQRDWSMVENVLNAKGLFGPGVDIEGNDTRGDYTIKKRKERVGLADENVILLKTDSPRVKQLLGQLRAKSMEKPLSEVTPESTLLPKLSRNAIKPLGEPIGYEERNTVLVAPMGAKDVRRAFENYNRNYQELNDYRKKGSQLSELLEKRHYTLEEIKVDGQTHTMIIPNENAQRQAELDTAINSGEIPLGKHYSLAQLPEEGEKKKLRR